MESQRQLFFFETYVFSAYLLDDSRAQFKGQHLMADNVYSQSTHFRTLTKGKGLVTCYSAAYMSQKCFTFSEVAANWRKRMTPHHIMWP